MTEHKHAPWCSNPSAGASTERLERLEGKIDRLIDVVVSHLNRDPDPVALTESILGPTDYEIWADALTIAAKVTPREDSSPAQHAANVEYEAGHYRRILRTHGLPMPTDDGDDEQSGFVCEACGDTFPTAGQRAAHEDEQHAASSG